MRAPTTCSNEKERCPYVTHDPRLARLVLGHADLKTLTSGCRWAEGRAYFPAGRYFDLVRHSEQPDDAL